MSSEVLTHEEWKPSCNPWFVALAVMLAAFMVVLDSSIANVALPHMAGSFSATNHEATWILTCYLVAEGVILPASAWMSNIWGRKNFLKICLILFTASSVLCGLATNMPFMLFARILQGIGGGALLPISQSILMESFPKEKRGMAMAVFGLGVVLAPVIGPTLGGWITDNYSWNWIFYINLPIGIIAFLLTEAFVEDPPYAAGGEVKRIDYLGFASLAIWLITLQVVLDNGQQHDWFETPWICWTAAASVISMIFFFVWEINYEDSIIDLSVFKDINYSIGTALSAVVNAILYSTLAILPMFLQSLLGYTAYTSGLAISPRGIGCILALGFVGYLTDKVDNRILVGVGLFLLGLSSMVFGSLNLVISMNNIIVPNVICGVALAFSFIPLTTVSMGTLKNHQLANATAIQTLLKNTGGAIGISIVSTMLSRYSQTHQAYLVDNLSKSNPVFQYKLSYLIHALGAKMNIVTATAKANYIMYGGLMKQATLCSFIDNFRFYGILCFLLIPSIFLLKKVASHKGSDEAPAMH